MQPNQSIQSEQPSDIWGPSTSAVAASVNLDPFKRDGLSSHKPHLAALVMVLCAQILLSPEIAAQDIPRKSHETLRQEVLYSSAGQYGEVSFSDTASPGAEPITHQWLAPSKTGIAFTQALTEEYLTIAEELEAERSEREAASAQTRKTNQRTQIYAPGSGDVSYVETSPRYLSPGYIQPGYVVSPRRHGHHPQDGKPHGPHSRPHRKVEPQNSTVYSSNHRTQRWLEPAFKPVTPAFQP